MIDRRKLLGTFTAGLVASPFLSRTAFAAGAPLSVVATTGMIADTARSIAGDAADVRALMGPGVDPHSYRQTRTDILAMTRAELVLWNGLYLEAQMEEVLGDLARRTTVRAVGEAVPVEKRIAHDTYENRFDPHVWMDPDLWMLVALAVRDALAETAPDRKADLDSNAEKFLSDLGGLADYGRAVLGTVPQDARVLVTAHDAFNYFGRAHDFEVIGIQGISTESEAGLNRITELVDTLVARRIGAVFVESSVSDRSIRALVEGAAAKGHEVRIGGELYSDAMGVPGTYEGTYIGMIDHNVTVIATALGGTTPPRGMSGKLSVGM